MAIERIAIENRDQWLSLRASDVTASIAGALLGVHPYSTAYGLYLLKKGMIAEDPEETAPMRRGRLLEPVAAQMLREERPDWKLVTHPVGYYYRDAAVRMGATPDVLAIDEQGRPGIVQIKSVEPSIFRRDWKLEDGSVEPPLWIVVQGIIEAHLTGAEWAAVAPMVIGFGVEMPIIPIPIHAGILDRIKVEIEKFWERIEASLPYDPDYARDGSLIAKLYPQDNGVEIDLSGDNRLPDLLDEREIVSSNIKELTGRKTTIDCEIKEKLGEASFGRLAGWTVSHKLQQRKGFVVEPTEFRMLRVKRTG